MSLAFCLLQPLPLVERVIYKAQKPVPDSSRPASPAISKGPGIPNPESSRPPLNQSKPIEKGHASPAAPKIPRQKPASTKSNTIKTDTQRQAREPRQRLKPSPSPLKKASDGVLHAAAPPTPDNGESSAKLRYNSEPVTARRTAQQPAGQTHGQEAQVQASSIAEEGDRDTAGSLGAPETRVSGVEVSQPAAEVSWRRWCSACGSLGMKAD